jgi:hypothetical protein
MLRLVLTDPERRLVRPEAVSRFFWVLWDVSVLPVYCGWESGRLVCIN